MSRHKRLTALLALSTVCLLLVSVATAGTTADTDGPEIPPVTVESLTILGMEPTEVVRWTPLRQSGPGKIPMIVAMTKALRQEGETPEDLLEEVLDTKYSVGIYAFDPTLQRWLPAWERVTGELAHEFVDGYEVMDVTGDGQDEVLVGIRYYGRGRALDFTIKSVGPDGVTDLLNKNSVYQGHVTGSSGHIYVDRALEDSDGKQRDVFAWTPSKNSFVKVREIRNWPER